jgi:hypothetical protein
MSGHKINDLWRYTLGCTDKIAFIFAVFVIYHNDYLARLDVADGLINGIELKTLLLSYV